MARVVAENTQLRKMVEDRDEKLSSSATELTTLQAARDEAEAKLDHNFDQTEELLKQSFLRAVHQAHVLYRGPSASGTFDLDNEVYLDRIMPIVEMNALVRQLCWPIEGKEDEDHED